LSLGAELGRQPLRGGVAEQGSPRDTHRGKAMVALPWGEEDVPRKRAFKKNQGNERRTDSSILYVIEHLSKENRWQEKKSREGQKE